MAFLRRTDVADMVDQLKVPIKQMPEWTFEALLDLIQPIHGRPIYLSRAELPKGCTAGAMSADTFDLIMVDKVATGQYNDWLCGHELGHIMLGHLDRPSPLFFSHLAEKSVIDQDESCQFSGDIERDAEQFAEQLVTFVYSHPHLHTRGRGGRLASVLE